MRIFLLHINIIHSVGVSHKCKCFANAPMLYGSNGNWKTHRNKWIQNINSQVNTVWVFKTQQYLFDRIFHDKAFFFVLFSAVVLVILFSLSLSISSGLGSGRMRWWKYGNGYYYCDQLAVIGHKINIGNIFIYRFLDAVCLAQQIAAARNGPNVKSGGMMTWTRIVRDLLWY